MTPETEGGSAGLVARAKAIILEPKAEWERIDAEPATVAGLFTGWVLILAAIPALCLTLGTILFGYDFLVVTYHPPIGFVIELGVAEFIQFVLSVFIVSIVIDKLAPSFGGTSNPVQATKVAAYSYTPLGVAGVLLLLPSLYPIWGLIGLYGFYLLFLGLPRLMKVAEDKSVPYIVAVIVAAAIVGLILHAITGHIASAM